VIGCATSEIAAGTMVHGHNVQFREFEGDARSVPTIVL
jgi:hypothetical protein